VYYETYDFGILRHCRRPTPTPTIFSRACSAALCLIVAESPTSLLQKGSYQQVSRRIEIIREIQTVSLPPVRSFALPAKTKVRIQLFKSFPPRRGFEFNSSARLTNTSSRRRPTRLCSMEPTPKQQQRRQATSRTKHSGSETQSGVSYELIEVELPEKGRRLFSSTRLHQNKSVLILT
jgi:hypothetical protein